MIHRYNKQTDCQHKIEINSPGHIQRRHQILSGKNACEYTSVHDLCNPLRPRHRQHIHGNIDRGLQKHDRQGVLPFQRKPPVYDPCQHKNAGPLHERKEADHKHLPLVLQQKTHRTLVAVYKLFYLYLSRPVFLQDSDTCKQSLNAENNPFHGIRSQHHRQQHYYQQRIQRKAQQKKRKILFQIPPQRPVPECQRPNADHHQHQLIDEGHRH